MTPMRLLPEAEEELRAAAEFYEAEQKGLGRALIQEVRRAYQFIAEQPLAGRVERGEVRVRTIARFPYRIYRAKADEIWSSPSLTADETGILAQPQVVT
jgi:plasmid stabilization system protein ParE